MVFATREGRTSIRVNWTPPPSHVRKYRIYYTTEDRGPGIYDWESVEIRDPVNSWLLTDLSADRAYAIKVSQAARGTYMRIAIGTIGKSRLSISSIIAYPCRKSFHFYVKNSLPTIQVIYSSGFVCRDFLDNGYRSE